MSARSSAGFTKAPISKVVITTCGAMSIYTMNSGGWRHWVTSLRPGEASLVKLFAKQFVFTQVDKMIFGLCLLYNFRVFERFMGSRKYAAWLMTTTGVWLAVQHSHFLRYGYYVPSLSGGPLPIIVSSLISYTFLPGAGSSRVMGFAPDKIFLYLAAAQYLSSESWMSILLGAAAGLFHRLSPLGYIQIPAFMARCCNAVFMPLLGTGEVTARPGMPGNPGGFPGTPRREEHGQGYTDQLLGGDDDWGHAGAFTRGGLQQRRRPLPQQAPPVVVNEEHVVTLTSLGFERERVIAALLQTSNDLTRASNLLLDA